MADRNNQNRTELTARQMQAIAAVIRARSVAAGCEHARISRDTWYSWKKHRKFRKEYMKASREVGQDAIDSVKLLADDAVEVLSRLLHARSAHVRLKAVTIVLDNLGRFIEQEELGQRLSELEATIEEHGSDDDITKYK